MILGLFAFLVGICITLILVGIFRPDESGFALIGFSLLFILSLIVLNGNLQVEAGAAVNTSFSYDSSGNIQASSQDVVYSYTDWDDSTAHQVGFWMSVFSAFGFIGMLFSIRGGWSIKNEG